MPRITANPIIGLVFVRVFYINITLIAGALVIAFGFALIGFAAMSLAKPETAASFLRLFASSARAHFTEQALRLIAGTAILFFSPSMWFSSVFYVFGWLIIITTIGLLLTPWRWHQRFSQRVIPIVIRWLKLYALGSFLLGAFLIYAASRALVS